MGINTIFVHMLLFHFSTLRHLMLHLNRLSEKVNDTGMTAKNLSIVWAPNLLRTPLSIHSGCDSGFGGVSIKLNGETGCSDGKSIDQKCINNNKNKTIIHQDARGTGSYNCAGKFVEHDFFTKLITKNIMYK